MRDSANGTALLQHPNHFAARAFDVEETLERAVVGEIGRLTKPQTQGLAAGPAHKGAHLVPLALRQGAPEDEGSAAADTAAMPGDFRFIGGARRHRGARPRTVVVLQAHTVRFAPNGGRMHA